MKKILSLIMLLAFITSVFSYGGGSAGYLYINTEKLSGFEKTTLHSLKLKRVDSIVIDCKSNLVTYKYKSRTKSKFISCDYFDKIEMDTKGLRYIDLYMSKDSITIKSGTKTIHYKVFKDDYIDYLRTNYDYQYKDLFRISKLKKNIMKLPITEDVLKFPLLKYHKDAKLIGTYNVKDEKGRNTQVFLMES